MFAQFTWWDEIDYTKNLHIRPNMAQIIKIILNLAWTKYISFARAFFKISGIGWGHNRVQFGILGMPFTSQFYPFWHPEVKVIINLNIHRSWGIGWGEILHPLYLKSGKAYRCRVTCWEQGVLEMPLVGSRLKGSYFRNSLLPRRY